MATTEKLTNSGEEKTDVTAHNLRYYAMCEFVPEDMLKPIEGGRLKGKSDINPQWRIKKLTEMFGALGDGWIYEPSPPVFRDGANGEVACFVDILLKYKTRDPIDGSPVWSEPIKGNGGSMFIIREKDGLRTNDDCVKMATTDAIGVAAKGLGVGGLIYMGMYDGKYLINTTANAPKGNTQKPATQSGTNKGGETEDPRIKELKILWARAYAYFPNAKEAFPEIFKTAYKTTLRDAPIETIKKASAELQKRIDEKKKDSGKENK